MYMWLVLSDVKHLQPEYQQMDYVACVPCVKWFCAPVTRAPVEKTLLNCRLVI